MGNRPGMIQTDHLQMNVGTSRGFMDNLSAGDNTKILDGIAGSMRVARYLLAFDPTALADDVWEYVPMPDPDLTALGGVPSADFGQMIRCSNKFKVLCMRARAIISGGVSGVRLNLQLKKSKPTGPLAADPDCLINPISFVDDEVNIQNLNQPGLGQPQAPIIGGAADEGLALFMLKEAGWTVTPVAVLELLITLQMVPELPPEVIIDPT